MLLGGILLCVQMVVQAQGAAPAQDSQHIMKDIRDRGTLRVAALSEPVFPFTVLQDGKWSGAEVNIANRIAEVIGVKLIWDATYRNEAEVSAALRANKADLALSRIKRDLDAASQVSYTKPYVTLHYVVMTNRMRIVAFHPADESLQSLKSLPLTIGTLDHIGYVEMTQSRFPSAKVVTYATMVALTNALKSGKIDAAFSDETEARFVFVEHPELGILFGYFNLFDIKSGIVVMLDWQKQQWVSWLNMLLEPVASSISVDNLFLITQSIPYKDHAP